MAAKSSGPDVNAPNVNHESTSDEDLIRGFILALGGGGRNVNTPTIYHDGPLWCIGDPSRPTLDTGRKLP